MMSRPNVLLCLIAACAAILVSPSPGPAQTGGTWQDTDSLAKYWYPDSLKENSQLLISQGASDAYPRWDSVELPKLEHQQFPSIFVTYTNGFLGAVKIIHRGTYSSTSTEGPSPSALARNGRGLLSRTLPVAVV
jgi:hypothetical protein